ILSGLRVLISAFGGQVEEIVGRIHQVDSALVRRIGAIDLAVLVPVKRAHALALIDVHVQGREVVNGLAVLELLRRERHVEIKIEICLEEETHLNRQPIRFLNGSISASGARETTAKAVSRSPMWLFTLSKWSAQNEQCGQPSPQPGPNMK